jgi:hypothetical protein
MCCYRHNLYLMDIKNKRMYVVQTFFGTNPGCQVSVLKAGVPCNATWQAGMSHGPRIQNYPIPDVWYEGNTLHLQIMA